MTLTHIEFPHTLWRNPSGACGFPFHGMSVQPSGKPMSLSHSTGMRRRMTPGVQTPLARRFVSEYAAVSFSS